MRLSLLAYLIAVAIVPPGYMSAPWASGTPFHLCPGDTRSALLISALANISPRAVQHHQHHQHQHHLQHHHSDVSVGDISASHTAAEPGCQFAGISAMPSGMAFTAASIPEPVAQGQNGPQRSRVPASPWLRPPVRSPPA